eukprot:TRINITY_DN4491_c0_g1_i1.p3 TRINITY_DN4491_c0_g1~~TRINITY_DN4491_c0_g1_i1.p3  ORF type:complete len:156 (-),score=35.23 TRINITY_DN4491_c0_g1_i1:475-942(-)
MARMVLLFLLLAAAGTAVTAAAAARVCRVADTCTRRLLSGSPGDIVADGCGVEFFFNKVCVPAILKPCVVKDTCAPKPVPLPLLRGGAFKNACGKTFHMSADCKLLPLSARCYKACARPVGKALASAIPGKPVTCATKCVDAEKKQQQKVRGGKK